MYAPGAYCNNHNNNKMNSHQDIPIRNDIVLKIPVSARLDFDQMQINELILHESHLFCFLTPCWTGTLCSGAITSISRQSNNWMQPDARDARQ